jgi:epoxyqueuosine reductase QueG
MSGVPAKAIGPEFFTQFFRGHAVDEFAIVPVSALRAPPGRRPVDLFPEARTMILFGRVMDDTLFYGSVAETAPGITAFRQELARISDDLAGAIAGSGASALAVSSVIVRDGKVRGSLSLRHCARDACLGEIGDNGLLLSPRFGNRLGLGAVLTDREIPAGTDREPPPALCTHCGLCIRACPKNALENGEVDMFRCLNITGAMPAPVLALFIRLMGVKALEPLLSAFANRVGSRSTVRCSACLMACPFFKKYRER